MTENNGFYSYVILIPVNSTSPIVYNLTAVDSSGNSNLTDTITLAVVDDDKPSYTFISQPIAGTTGESVIVNLTVNDNIGIQNVSINLGGVDYNMSNESGDYTYEISIPDNSINNITYSVNALDVNGNANLTPLTTINVSDNDLPVFVNLSI